jgi:hypothetical protein
MQKKAKQTEEEIEQAIIIRAEEIEGMMTSHEKRRILQAMGFDQGLIDHAEPESGMPHEEEVRELLAAQSMVEQANEIPDTDLDELEEINTFPLEERLRKRANLCARLGIPPEILNLEDIEHLTPAECYMCDELSKFCFKVAEAEIATGCRYERNQYEDAVMKAAQNCLAVTETEKAVSRWMN